ncbi:MAG: hypothetical protein DLM55_09800 [Acidimicrobiales bacterium]|nr:MAG: hypothetical protein DLM55_09800 [Acidimicrobiales bacterium]
MTSTSIKVPHQLRDRIALLAEAEHVPMSIVLDRAIRELEDRARVDEMWHALGSYRRRDPEGYREYIAGGPAAADDWPEYQ